MSCSSFWSTNTGLPVLVWSSSTCVGVTTRRFVDSDPHTGHHRTCWVLDVLVIRQDTFLDLLGGFLSTYGSHRSWWLGFWFWLDSLGVFAASSDFWIQFLRPIIFEGHFRWWSRWHIYFLVYDFFRLHHNDFRDTISWECIVEDDGVRSCLIELQSFPLSKLKIGPIHRILVPFPLSFVRCKTWFGQIKLLRILVVLIHGIHGCKEYRLSFTAWILSSRYQSWINDRMSVHPIW